MHSIRHVAAAGEQPLSSEACLSGRAIEQQIHTRVINLLTLETSEPELRTFLHERLLPVLRETVKQARDIAQSAGIEFEADLSLQKRSLVPADFGFHNALRRPDGTLAFLDFEYFGWDDPVKLTADIILHPGMSLSATQKRRFRGCAERIYDEDCRFAARLRAYLPLFGLRWALILLNEFIPDRWNRRVLAGTTETWSESKLRQLRRAANMLDDLRHEGEIDDR